MRFSDAASCCVIVASGGYPAKYEKGFPITGLEQVSGACVSVAGAALQDGRLVTSGGRVLGVTAVADTLREAVALAYKNVEQIRFEGCYWRHDIGKRALEA